MDAIPSTVKAALGPIVDQAGWAATNFVLISGLANTLAPADFGAAGIVLTATILLTGITLAMSSEVLAVSRPRLALKSTTRSNELELRRRTAGAMLFGGLVTPVIVATAFIALVPVDERVLTAWALVALAPISVLAECLRATCYALLKPRLARRMTLVWAAVQSAGTIACWLIIGSSPWSVLAPWGLGCVLAAATGWAACGVAPARPHTNRGETRRSRAYVGEYLLTAGPQQAITLVAAALLSLPDAAMIRAMQSLFGPLNTLITGIRNAFLPTMAGLTTGRSILQQAGRVASLTAVATLFMTGALAIVPEVGRAVMGASWPGSSSIVWAFGLGRAAFAGVFGAVLALRALDRTRLSFNLRLLTAGLTTCGFIAGISYDLEAGLWLFALGLAISATCWWASVLRCSHSVTN